MNVCIVSIHSIYYILHITQIRYHLSECQWCEARLTPKWFDWFKKAGFAIKEVSKYTLWLSLFIFFLKTSHVQVVRVCCFYRNIYIYFFIALGFNVRVNLSKLISAQLWLSPFFSNPFRILNFLFRFTEK